MALGLNPRARCAYDVRAMADPNCEECTRLRKEYQRATVEHVRLDNEVKLVFGNLSSFIEASARANGAEAERNAARRAVEEHQTATGH
jgi:hypothetical protein